MNLENRVLQTSKTDLSLNGIRVLVVDNDADTRLLYTIILEEYGAEVLAVGSAKNALLAVEQLKPHLLISDIYLPGEDGYSLIYKIRSLDPVQGGHIPAIAVTGLYKDLCDLNPTFAKFQLHFTKPIDLKELVTAAVSLTKPERIPQ
ncbi:response regulator [Leptolyngbyaceae cyanobacterium UHCC 1019]